MGHADTHRTFHEIFNARDWDRLRELNAPRYRYVDVPTGTTTTTFEESVAFSRTWVDAFSDARIEDDEYLEGPDFSVCRFHGRGTHDGTFGGIAPTGRPTDNRFCEILFYDTDGRIAGGELYYDVLTTLRQVGAVDVPLPEAVPAAATTAAAEQPTGPVGLGLVETHRLLNQLFGQRDYETMRRYVAASFRYVDVPLAQTMHGVDEFAAYAESLVAGFSDAHLEDERYLEGPGFTVCRYTGRGTHDGEFAGIPATNREVAVEYCELHLYDEDGRVTLGESFYDQLGFLQQLGVVEAPTAAQAPSIPRPASPAASETGQPAPG